MVGGFDAEASRTQFFQYGESGGTSCQDSPSGQTITRPAIISSSTNIITAPAISSGRSGAGGSLSRSSGVIRACSRLEEGVSTSPGHTQLTRTPIRSLRSASEAERRTTPALAAPYSGLS